MPDANELVIKLKMDRSFAEAEAAAFHKAERSRIAQTLTDAEVAEKARTAFIQRENAQRIQAEANAQKTAIEQARDAAEAKKKLDKDAARAKAESVKETNALIRQADKVMNDITLSQLREISDATRAAAKEKRDNAREIAAEISRIEAQSASEAKAWNKRELTDEEVQQRAISAIVAKENRSRVNALVGAHKTEVDLLRERDEGFQRFASRATSALTSFGAQMIGIGSAAALFSEIDKGFQRVRDNVFRSTEVLHDFRETLLELAALKDRMGDTTTEAADTLRFQAATGQSRADAIGLQTGILGVAEAAVRGGRIDQAGVREVGMGVGRIQAVLGGDASSFGYLAGQLINQMPVGPNGKVDPQKAVQEFAAMQALAQPGGPGFSSLARQYSKASGYVGNGIATPREAMGAISALSISEGEEAGTRFQQLIRATVGSLGRNRSVKVAEGDNAVGTATYLKSIGATPAMNFMDIARLITADVSRVKASTEASGREFNPISYLQSRGYGNEESVNSLLTMGNLLNSGAYDKTFGSIINDPNAGSGVMAEATSRLASDPGLQARQTKAAAEIAKMAPGADQERMVNLRRAAYARLASMDSMKGMPSFEDIETSGMLSPSNWLYGYKGSIGQEAARMVIESARANGVPIQTYREGGNSSALGGAGYSYETASDAEVSRAARELSNRGVNFGQQAGQAAAEVVANKLGVAADKLGMAADRMNQAAIPAGRPKAPSPRP